MNIIERTEIYILLTFVFYIFLHLFTLCTFGVLEIRLMYLMNEKIAKSSYFMTFVGVEGYKEYKKCCLMY